MVLTNRICSLFLYSIRQSNRNYRIDPERGIIVPNYCAAQLPKITVEIKSGRTTYRFTGRYDGNRSLSGKLLDRKASDNQEEN